MDFSLFTLNTGRGPDMSDDKKQNSEHEADDRETKEAEDADKKEGSTGAAAPADDDIIIK